MSRTYINTENKDIDVCVGLDRSTGFFLQAFHHGEDEPFIDMDTKPYFKETYASRSCLIKTAKNLADPGCKHTHNIISYIALDLDPALYLETLTDGEF